MVAWSKGVEMEKKMDRLPIYLDKYIGLDLGNERKTLNSSEPQVFICKTGLLILHLYNIYLAICCGKNMR